MSALLTSKCWSHVATEPDDTMTWTHEGGRWRGNCKCGLSVRAASGDAKQLDERARL